MAIKNSVRNVLPGYGTSGLRGGTASGASPQTILVPTGMSMGKLRIKGTALTAVAVTGTDGTTTETIFSGTLSGAGAVSAVADFISDLNLVSFTVTAAGMTDFEIWGQPGAV